MGVGGDVGPHLLMGPRSQISALSRGTKVDRQKGQLEFRLESSDVQPAMISSSYTRQSHVLQREQLEISSWTETRWRQEESGQDSSPD